MNGKGLFGDSIFTLHCVFSFLFFSFQSCSSRTNEFIEFSETNLTLSNTDVCLEFDGEDPCCNITLEWERCCDAEVSNLLLFCK